MQTNEAWYGLQNKLSRLASPAKVDYWVDGSEEYVSDITLEIPENVVLFNAKITYTGDKHAVLGEADKGTCTIVCTNPKAVRSLSWFAKLVMDWYKNKLPARIKPQELKVKKKDDN